MDAWHQWMLDSELDFDGFVSGDFGENEQFAAALGSGCDMDLVIGMSTTIRVILTALLW